jgi:hypothetical protein
LGIAKEIWAAHMAVSCRFVGSLVSFLVGGWQNGCYDDLSVDF